MNSLHIIGRLTKDPELRTTQSGINVCSFTVAVNRRKKQGQEQDADFFNVTAWREVGESCAKYLSKGKLVSVTGPVSVRTYQAKDGTTRASAEVNAADVEFLSPREQQKEESKAPEGYAQVSMEDGELPF